MIKKYLSVLVLCSLFLASSNVMAATVVKGLVACVSDDLLDEATMYLVKKDENSFIQLIMSGQCTILEVGEPVGVIDRGFITTTIRYKGVKLFTPSEAVR